MVTAEGTPRRLILALILAAFGYLHHTPSLAQEAPKLSLPIACEPGKTCFIQSYVDIDPSPEVRDFACGSATYEGHKGTDFRLQSAAAAKAGVDVVASADGTAKGVRDGMPDIFVSKAGLDSVKNRECGNGAVVDHGNGWETQYCHMLMGSVAVKAGDKITRGQKLGHVGYSGLADFAHVHLEVRKDGNAIDPFSGHSQDNVCSTDTTGAKGLWDPTAIAAFKYSNGTIVQAAFTGAIPDHNALEAGDESDQVQPASAQLLFYVRAMNLKAGDRIRFSLKGPGGFALDSPGAPIDRNKASFTGYSGKRLTAARWLAGTYDGRAQLVRDGYVISEMSGSLELAE